MSDTPNRREGAASREEWPPAWFGAVTTDRDDVAERTEETLSGSVATTRKPLAGKGRDRTDWDA